MSPNISSSFKFAIIIFFLFLLGLESSLLAKKNKKKKGKPNVPEIYDVSKLGEYHNSKPPLKGWVVVLDADPQKLNQCSQNPSWKIIENNSSIQAITFSEGLTMSSFRGAVSIGLQPDEKLAVDQPCLAIWNHDHLWLNDPTQKGLTMNVHWQKQEHFINLPKGGKNFELSNKSPSETK
jgi:hypothetical protein